MSEVVKIGHLEVCGNSKSKSYFSIKGQSIKNQRALVEFGGVFRTSKKISKELRSLGFYNITGHIDDFSCYRAEISFYALDRLKIVRSI